jgi:cell division protein FtsI (penicillin-binding protein 3)
MTGRAAESRLRLVAVVCLLPLVLVLARTVWLTIVRGDELRRRADTQHLQRAYQPAQRGSVRDRDGNDLAVTVYNQSVVADPTLVTDPKGTARILATALDLPVAQVETQLRSPRREVYIQRKFTPSLDQRVDLSSLPGVFERLELKRVYPRGEFAAHVVGFVDAAGIGQAGIEKEYEALLRGKPGWATQLRDGNGDVIQALGKHHKPSQSGCDITLTIDSALQDVGASELKKQAEALHAKSGVFLAVDPRTGEILAMASWPTFDPERMNAGDRSALRNRSVTDPYEPGSTFKVVAAVTALKEKLLEPGTPIHCEMGRYSMDGAVFTDHHPYGTLTFQDCFAHSSNIAFAKVGKRCGPALYDTARSLGFGVPTGVGLPGESSGLLYPPRRWSGRTAPTMAIGYEVMVTPLQLAMAYAAVANDGVLMRPQLIRSITDSDGRTVFRSRPEPVRRVMEPAVARTVRTFMRRVMTDGTGKSANLEWVEAGGKTGTAEKLVDGHYSGSKHYASFVGIAPYDDPEIVCMILIDEPQGSTFGGSAAAPVFKEVLEAVSRLRGARLCPDYATMMVGEPPADAKRLGPGAVEADEATAEFPPTPSPEGGVPDVRGQSLRQALWTLQINGMRAEVSGTGVVIRQEPAPGTDSTTTVTLECALPPARIEEDTEDGDDVGQAVLAVAGRAGRRR